MTVKSLDGEKDLKMKGIITARTCPRCGHHEIGITTRDGEYYPLKAGTLVHVMEAGDEKKIGEDHEMAQGPSMTEPPVLGPAPSGFACDAYARMLAARKQEEEEDELSQYEIWVPEPLRGDRRLRIKYGVTVKPGTETDAMSPDAYRAAYIKKLESLIEREICTPIAVLLDRFFNCPELGSGSPSKIAETLWEELDEIKTPAMRVMAWLHEKNDETLAGLVHPLSAEELENAPLDKDGALGEFAMLSLEDFLEVL